MKSDTHHADAGKLRIDAQHRHSQRFLAMLPGLILVTISVPTVWAEMSNSTGTIEGRPPTATGALSVMFPGGTTAVTNNAVVSTTLKPTDFGVSALGLTLQDLDGDTGLSSSMEPAAVTWNWQYNNVALTPAQLAAPFSTNFLGKTLTVTASAPVTVSSLTGVPTAGSPSTLSSATYSLVVPASPPVVRVNGASFAMNSGFPKTGFSQAQFQFWMDGTGTSGNSNYTFAADPLAPWVTVNPTTGIVKFTSVPAAAQTVNITITDNRGGPATTFSFRVGTWFINKGSNYTTAAGADSYCASLSGYATPSYQKMTNAEYNTGGTRAPDGRLWDEWGDLSVADYSDSGWLGNYVWALEPNGSGRYFVYLNYGYLLSNHPSNNSYVACSRTL
ncbi:hypothetical protein [Yersinia intermedia]|uniref:hypothetical protein n=1 Tax=Yersinia intermedia TaxID=631 RepID=UPI002243CB1E|nr:hypothetical protein [Yersinia intermedia]MCW8114059.1 hypothetical protein [Yersinia intermedia]MDA5518692.1 hypothetical protein [Yersinia intermedia]